MGSRGVHTGEALACEGCGAASGRGRGSTFQGIILDLLGVAARLCGFLISLFVRVWFQLASTDMWSMLVSVAPATSYLAVRLFGPAWPAARPPALPERFWPS